MFEGLLFSKGKVIDLVGLGNFFDIDYLNPFFVLSVMIEINKIRIFFVRFEKSKNKIPFRIIRIDKFP